MYYVYNYVETLTGFIYADMSDKPWVNKPGFSLTDMCSVESNKLATRILLAHRKQCKQYNLNLDPDYIPPSRRVAREGR